MIKLFINVFLLTLLYAQLSYAEKPPIDKLKLPIGFGVNVYASVPDARQMALGNKGVVFVGSRSAGRVYALIPNKQKTQAEKVIVIAKNLKSPNGVAFFQGDLYVAETNRILRYKNIEEYLASPPRPEIVSEDLPSKAWHGSRYIKFGPDGWLYVAVGAPCNICLRDDKRFATIIRMRRDGSYMQVFAKGVRNSVGFAWDPKTNKLWFTDNGRDWLGDDLPPDELNYAPHRGMNFGFPYVYGDNVPDPKFAKMIKPGQKFTPPALPLDAHVAPLGMVFYIGEMLPKNYRNSIIIAEHGSWNRSDKSGYRVINVRLEDNKVVNKKVLVSGWLQGQQAWGRPVDVLVMPDGSVLISDDYAGVIYRLYYT